MTNESDYRFQYVNRYINDLMDGNLTLQFEDIDLKHEKKPVDYVEKIEKWLEFKNHSRDDDPDEFDKLTREIFTHILTLRLAGVIVDQSCEYCNMKSSGESDTPSYRVLSESPPH